MNVVWVATNGTPGGPGTIDRPFDDPQRGYNAAAAKYTNVPSTVVIAGGSYTGGLAMTAGSVHVLGFSRPQLLSLSVLAGSKNILGKQRVENVIVGGVTTVAADGGSDVKFHNCRFQMGLGIYGDINNLGAGMFWGWGQAGAGTGQDAAGNTEHQGMYPGWGGLQRGFPAAWQD